MKMLYFKIIQNLKSYNNLQIEYYNK